MVSPLSSLLLNRDETAFEHPSMPGQPINRVDPHDKGARHDLSFRKPLAQGILTTNSAKYNSATETTAQGEFPATSRTGIVERLENCASEPAA